MPRFGLPHPVLLNCSSNFSLCAVKPGRSFWAPNFAWLLIFGHASNSLGVLGRAPRSSKSYKTARFAKLCVLLLLDLPSQRELPWPSQRHIGAPPQRHVVVSYAWPSAPPPRPVRTTVARRRPISHTTMFASHCGPPRQCPLAQRASPAPPPASQRLCPRLPRPLPRHGCPLRRRNNMCVFSF